MRRLVRSAILLLVLAVPSATAQTELRWDGTPDAQAVVEATGREKVLSFRSDFVVADASALYVKVLPTPGNPAYKNGTPNQHGWWTSVFLGDEPTSRGATNGSRVVELGSLAAGEHQLRFEVHAPAGALATIASYELDYSLVARSAPVGNSSGGRIAPSIPFTAEIDVVAAPESGPFGVLVPALAVAGIGGAALATFILWRRRKNAAGEEPPQETEE